MKKNEYLAKEIIESILYMNVATITPDGRPWNTPLVFAYDKHFHLYWLSWKKNQHSINVKNNPQVFATIYDSTVPTDTGFGVYLEGTAWQIKNLKETLLGLKCIYGRRNRIRRPLKEFMNKFPRRMYKFKPKRVWINGYGDVDNNYVDVRVELDMEELKQAIKEK